jgi:K+:H+ antiporter
VAYDDRIASVDRGGFRAEKQQDMTSYQIQLLFVGLAVVLVAARIFGALAVRIGQPAVVGEIAAGILLGPTLFGELTSRSLFRADILSLHNALAQVGVALFMFLIGLELDNRVLAGARGRAVGAAIGSILVPFVLGVGLALVALRDHVKGNPTVFVVFIGLSISVTAFPVLARILMDRGMSKTRLAGLAIATAAIVDVLAWVALAGVQLFAGGASGQFHRVALLVPFVVVMVLVVRPLLRRALVRDNVGVAMTHAGLVAVLVGALLSGAATEAFGMHYIFGAFLFGLILPRDGAEKLRSEIHDRTVSITSLLLPIYFMVAGLNVNLTAISAVGLWQLAGILVVAVFGKMGGAFLGARALGLPPRPALALGTLMNTRGLTELVILGVGLDAGLLDRSLYSLMVVMALVTTAMTGPLLVLLRVGTADAADRLDMARSGPPRCGEDGR